MAGRGCEAGGAHPWRGRWLQARRLQRIWRRRRRLQGESLSGAQSDWGMQRGEGRITVGVKLQRQGQYILNYVG
jgi:hypothetical protein